MAHFSANPCNRKIFLLSHGRALQRPSTPASSFQGTAGDALSLPKGRGFASASSGFLRPHWPSSVIPLGPSFFSVEPGTSFGRDFE